VPNLLYYNAVKKEAAKNPEITQIRVGDVFSYELVRGETGNPTDAVIVRIESKDMFHGCIIITRDGKEALHPWGGSFASRDIVAITDHWDADRIVRALETGMDITRIKFCSQQDFDTLRKRAQEPPVVLTETPHKYLRQDCETGVSR
jgi:hypothetical protein